VTSVTDASGYYRLNLPPGTYVLAAELQGFSTFRREGLIMRAGLTTVDVDLKIGNLPKLSRSPAVADDRDQPAHQRDQHRRRVAALAPITSRRLFATRSTWRRDRIAQRGRRRGPARVTSAARTSKRTRFG
jgi:hypothetical protein